MNSNENDGTIIVPNEKLQSIILANKVGEEDGEKLQRAFSGLFAVLDEWGAKDEALVIDRADQLQEIEIAQTGAKVIKNARVAYTKEWKEIKAPALAYTQALDAINRAVLAEIEPLETSLKWKAETAERLAKAERDLLEQTRKNLLLEAGHAEPVPGLADMPEASFNLLLSGARAAAQQRKEEADKAEADRLAAEEADRLAKEAAENAVRLRHEREVQLISIGAQRTKDERYGDFLRLGKTEVYVYDLNLYDEQAWQGIVDSITAEHERIQSEIEEADRLAKIGQARREQLLLVGEVKTADELAPMSEETFAEVLRIATKAKENKDRRAAQRNQFMAQLVALGASKRESTLNSGMVFELGNCIISEVAMDNEEIDFDAVIANFKNERNRLDEEARQIAEKNRLRESRLMQLQVICKRNTCEGEDFQLGNVRFDSKSIADLSDEQFKTLLESFAAEKSRLEAEETARVAAEKARETGIRRRDLLAKEGDDKSAEYLANLSEEEWEALYSNSVRLNALAVADAAHDKIKASEAAQQQEIEQSASDSEKLTGFLNGLRNVLEGNAVILQLPKIEDSGMAEILKTLCLEIQAVVADAESKL